jgi:hypothetical protein
MGWILWLRNRKTRPPSDESSGYGIHSFDTDPSAVPCPPVRIVDNRTFVLGLDHLYRETIKGHERTELLTCARTTAGVLGVGPADVPIEGYYSDDEQLTDYVRLMRALQMTTDAARPRVEHLPEFHRLLDVVSSPIFGPPKFDGHLLPNGTDPLSQALLNLDSWSVSGLAEESRRIAHESDDISLVGLAARTGDAVLIAATRESVVLYAAFVLGMKSRPETPRYSWEVDDELSRHAMRFVKSFNALLGESLPLPGASNANVYFEASCLNKIHQRCVRIGADMMKANHYHWAIRRTDSGTLEVDDFWDSRIWTTQMYRAKCGLRPVFTLGSLRDVELGVPPSPPARS